MLIHNYYPNSVRVLEAPCKIFYVTISCPSSPENEQHSKYIRSTLVTLVKSFMNQRAETHEM